VAVESEVAYFVFEVGDSSSESFFGKGWQRRSEGYNG